MLLRKNLQNIIHPIVIFIAVQLTWLSLVALWIYFYISNHIILKEVGNQISPKLMPGSYHVLVLIFGCILLVVLQGGFYFIYIYLNRQTNLNRLQDHFMANVTHELKSPLASIQLYLETLDSRQVPKNRQQEFLKLMIKDAKRLEAVIDKIVGAITIDQRKTPFNYKVYNMRTIIPMILKEVLAKYPVKISNTIHLEKTQSCRCVLNKESFKIIFINLIDNAIKYSSEKLLVTIRSYCNDKYFVIEFQDSGIGIPAKEQKRVFRKFYRVYGYEVPNVRGTGLGLYIVREIVRYHGGRIRALSPGKNSGTIIRIELPIYKKTKKRFINRLLKQTIKKKKRSEVHE